MCDSDLYDGSKTKKILEENIVVNLCDLWHKIPKIQATTEKNYKLDSIKYVIVLQYHQESENPAH